MRVFTKHQREQFNVAINDQRKKARALLDELGCFAVYFGYADYGKNNLAKRYEFCLQPLNKALCDKLDEDTRLNFPDRALFMAFMR